MNKPTIGHYASHQRDVTAREDSALNAALRSSTVKVEHPEIARLRAELEASETELRIVRASQAESNAEVERLRAELAEEQAKHAVTKAELAYERMNAEQVEAELAECKRDAERYRWLRGTVPESSSRWARWRLECWMSGAWHALRGLHLDTCIDAARKGEEKP